MEKDRFVRVLTFVLILLILVLQTAILNELQVVKQARAEFKSLFGEITRTQDSVINALTLLADITGALPGKFLQGVWREQNE